MEYVTKEDIRKLLQEKKGDRAETRVAIQLNLLALFIMILGSFYWFLTYFNQAPNILLWFPLNILIGGCLSGFTIFFTQIGAYLYYRFHEPFLARHWLYQGVVRTFSQIFFFGSFIIIFVLCWRFYPDFDVIFLGLFIILSIPVELGTYCSRVERIRNWFEDVASKENEDSKERTPKG